MPTFVGLDLAWTSHREPVPYESGLCVLEGRESADLRCSLIEARRLHVGALAEQVDETAGGGRPVVVAIDAPLIVTQQRTAESALNRVFGRFHAGAYHANLTWLQRKDLRAGPLLGEALNACGFSLDPGRLDGRDGVDRVALEVFPHTIHIRLFGLEERLAYKKGRVSSRRRGMRAYQEYLQDWLHTNAPGVLEHSAVRQALAAEAIADLPGSSKAGPSLKHYEDMLDGLTCALAAWLAWQSPGNWETFGDARNGYIVAPREMETQGALP
ncbi:MAG: DUF429 domain-containing protein [Dehalococcoidia bacterium]|nr:DUF429 domain-containing protein [Dehalococcoidia bacterium]